MSVKKDKSGRRSIEVEIEVPGTPEQVWEAIATGPGMSSWFMAVDFEGREGADFCIGHGEAKQKAGEITEWDPPRRYVGVGKSCGPEGPDVANEWTVEAKSGGTCVVRVVNSLFASGEDWDGQLGDLKGGWTMFFEVLKLYMAHHRGQPCTILDASAPTSGEVAPVWEGLLSGLGLAGKSSGEAFAAPDGAPAFAGTVDSIGARGKELAILRLTDPLPGIAALTAFPMGGATLVCISLYLYGDGAEDAVASQREAWQSWVAERFAPVAS